MTGLHFRALTWGMLALPLLTTGARADAVVSACASDTQPGANLAKALAAGGVIRFACPPGATIRMTGQYVLTGSTLVDGGDAVTLDGRGIFGPLLSARSNLILRRLTLRGFAQRPIRPASPGFLTIGRLTGSVLSASGDAELDHVTIEGSESPVDIRGNAAVRASAFVGNRGGFALVVGGVAFIERTRFTGNRSALLMGGGQVRSSDFTGQTAGAVRVSAPNSPVEIRHSSFAATRGGPALAISQRSGRAGPQTVTLRANAFRDNDGGAGGGAIDLFDQVRQARDRGQSASVIAALAALPPTSFVLAYNRFEANRGGHGGAIAANLASTGGLVSTGDLFIGNSAGAEGGAVSVTGGALRLSHALFTGNQAGGRGAAVAVAADARATIGNALVVRNAGPAGVIAGGAVMLVNVTIADNAAAGVLLEDPSARLANAILARNRPVDCGAVPAGSFQGGNLASDASCPGVVVGDAFLDSFYVPAAGSPALIAGDPALCRAAPVGGFDLPFQGRLDPQACALGAFERTPVRKLARRTDRQQPHATAADEFPEDEGYQPPPGEARTPGNPGSTPNENSPAAPADTGRLP